MEKTKQHMETGVEKPKPCTALAQDIKDLTANLKMMLENDKDQGDDLNLTDENERLRQIIQRKSMIVSWLNKEMQRVNRRVNKPCVEMKE